MAGAFRPLPSNWVLVARRERDRTCGSREGKESALLGCGSGQGGSANRHRPLTCGNARDVVVQGLGSRRGKAEGAGAAGLFNDEDRRRISDLCALDDARFDRACNEVESVLRVVTERRLREVAVKGIGDRLAEDVRRGNAAEVVKLSCDVGEILAVQENAGVLTVGRIYLGVAIFGSDRFADACASENVRAYKGTDLILECVDLGGILGVGDRRDLSLLTADRANALDLTVLGCGRRGDDPSVSRGELMGGGIHRDHLGFALTAVAAVIVKPKPVLDAVCFGQNLDLSEIVTGAELGLLLVTDRAGIYRLALGVAIALDSNLACTPDVIVGRSLGFAARGERKDEKNAEKEGKDQCGFFSWGSPNRFDRILCCARAGRFRPPLKPNLSRLERW